VCIQLLSVRKTEEIMFRYRLKQVSVLLIVIAAVLAMTLPVQADDHLPPTPTPKTIENPEGDHPHQVFPQEPAEFSALEQVATTCTGGVAGEYPCQGIDFMSRVPLSSFGGSPSSAGNLWGYVDLDDNREYAIIGLNTGTGIVEVTDPANPRVVGTIPGVTSQWRETRVLQVFNQTTNHWDGYAYVTTEGSGGGLQIIDLSQLPNSVSLATTWTGVTTSHTSNISNIDQHTNVANNPSFPPVLYISGSNRGGVRFISLANPTSPVELGAWTETYSHDTYAHVFSDSRASQCAAGHNPCEVLFNFAGTPGLKVIDVTNKSAPVTLSTLNYPNRGYTHSGWISNDTNFIFLHDETDEQNFTLNTIIRTINIANFTAPSVSNVWTGPTRAIDHNGYTIGNKLYFSNYTRGVGILDVTNPNAPTQTAFFDTYPTNNGATFNGAWGVYPYLPSGSILISDIQRGLIVVREQTSGPTPTPTQTFTPSPTGTGLPGGTVFFDNFETDQGWVRNPNGTDTATAGLWERGDPEATNSSGSKQLGNTVSGTNDLVTGRLAGSSAGVHDIDGGITSIRSPLINLPATGNLQLSFSYYLAHGSNATNADFFRIRIVSGTTTTTVFERLGSATDVDAAWASQTASLNSFAGQSVHILIETADAGTASLVEAALDDVSITASDTPTATPSPTITSTPSGGDLFFDNFETNLGWTNNPNGTDTATTGLWERGDPEATDSTGPKQLGNTVSGVNDLVTGRLAGTSAGAQDIDSGVTSIRSPAITLTGGSNYSLSFNYYLAHGSNATNADFLRVKIISGTTTTTVFERLGSATDVDAAWTSQTIDLNSFTGQTIQIVIEAADSGTASLVEAAVDDVRVTR
jgi:choice-of-anchor B domain-containing protein